ncbi:hypothetical protein ACGFYQ_09105 [Streptomyces sp. NPDC048258]|uniref:hypothetical protein n=1 Tax=Streptomyces sp. NPDC048258 TaxID=3365527 RepID=UPI0037106F49
MTATITGPDRYLARAALAEHGFRWTSDATMALARIDHDEPHYADQAARALRDGGTTVEIDPALQEEIATKWTYGNYPMTWLTQDEVREVSAEAQRIHDDIAVGRLTIHLFLGQFRFVHRVVSQRDGHAAACTRPEGPPTQPAPGPKSHRGCLLKQARRCRWVPISSST